MKKVLKFCHWLTLEHKLENAAFFVVMIEMVIQAIPYHQWWWGMALIYIGLLLPHLQIFLYLAGWLYEIIWERFK